MQPLEKQQCKPCEGGTPPLADAEIKDQLRDLPGWAHKDNAIEKTFQFKNYYETSAFVNAVVWIAHQADHHPDIAFGYKQCTIRYSTHSIGGISSNDLICAAKVNALQAAEA